MKIRVILLVICLGFSFARASTVCPTNLGGDVSACSGETVILNGESPNGVFEYAWFKDNVLLSGQTQPTLMVTEDGLYRVELTEGGTSCSDEATVTFEDGPIVTQPTPFYYCDEDDDGIAQFDLTVKNDEITNGNTDLEVSYYLTEMDALQQANPIVGTFVNTIPNLQVVFALVQDLATGCTEIVPLELIVVVIIPGEATDLVLADDDGDGFEVFDLTVNNGFILNGLNPDDNEVTYHENAADADNGTNAFLNPTAYTNVSNPQEIFARVSNLPGGCHDTTSFTISLGEPVPDQDNDGVPDMEEDVNGNGNLDDDDTDDDMIPNYLDSDDDGDLVETIDEITGIGAGRLLNRIFIDTDDDMIENYLDDDDDGDLLDTKDEDYNNNGDPLDDDTNGNDIPDFLEMGVTLGVGSLTFENVNAYPNPVISTVVFRASNFQNELTITVYNVLGKQVLIKTIPVNDGAASVDLSRLPSGMYLAQLSNAKRKSVVQLIKQ